MFDRTAMSPYGALLTGHDAGHFDLPADVMRARRAETTIAARLAAVRTELAAANLDIATATAGEKIADLVTAGRKMADHPGSDILAADDRRRQLIFDEAAVSEAQRVASERFRLVLRDAAERIVTDALRPAFDEVIARVRELAPTLAGLDLDSAEDMTKATDEAREARTVLQGQVPRWTAILGAHGRLLGFDRESAAYTPLRSVDTLYPRRTVIMGKVAPPPWPSDPMARLLWYVITPGVELWLPTLDEEQAAYEAAEEAKPKMPQIFGAGTRSAPSPRATSPRPNLSTRRHGGPGESRIKIPTE